jgi:hypothetical protein
VLQLAVALGYEQVVPQLPQFDSVLRLVSQPLSGLPSQSPQPLAQDGVQFPFTQLVVPWVFVHWLPQDPQFAVVVMAVSQPSAVPPVQSAYPVLQAPIEQVLPPQTPVALV